MNLNLVSKLVVVIASMSVIGSAHALDHTFNLGTVSPTVIEQTDFFSQSGYSFTDVFNFTVGTQYQTVNAGAVQYTPAGTNAQLTHVSNLKLNLFAGSDAIGSLLGTVSSLDGSQITLSGLLNPGNYSAQVTGMADGQLGGGFKYSVAAAIPEPAEWMMLACGLVVVAFMARRKTRLMAG